MLETLNLELVVDLICYLHFEFVDDHLIQSNNNSRRLRKIEVILSLQINYLNIDSQNLQIF